MMRSLRRVLMLSAWLAFATNPALAEGVKIIANPSVKADSITMDELKSVFLEKTNSLSDSSHVEPVLQKGTAAHDAFCKQYLEQRTTEIRAYYLALAFTGKGSVPKQFDSDAQVVAYVARTKGAIGYVSSAAGTDGVKILAVVSQGHKSERVLLTRVEPQYPETLRQLQIEGIVRLEVTISARGTVENVTILGGNPILAESAANAVKQWIYAPGPSRTTTQVLIPFDPHP